MSTSPPKTKKDFQYLLIRAGCPFKTSDKLDKLRQLCAENNLYQPPLTISLCDACDKKSEADGSGYIYSMYITSEDSFVVGYLIVKTLGDVIQCINKYPLGSKLMFCTFVNDAKKTETSLISKLKYSFSHAKDCDGEYFKGDHDAFIRSVSAHIHGY